MSDHTTHFDDCGCKSARLEADERSLILRIKAAEAENAQLQERIGFAHSCSQSCSRDLCVNRRLRETLREIDELCGPPKMSETIGTLGHRFTMIRDAIRAALHGEGK